MFFKNLSKVQRSLFERIARFPLIILRKSILLIKERCLRSAHLHKTFRENYLLPKKSCSCFFKGYHKEHVFKIIKQKSITILSWSSWKSNNDISFAYFPRPNFAQRHSVWVLIFMWNKSLIILYSSFIFNFF